MKTGVARCRVVDFENLPVIPCPCGDARRAFTDLEEFPGTLHITDIMVDAALHYHKKISETYYFLECGEGAKMQLDEDIIPVKAGMSIYVPPGVRHRAIGAMRVLILALPKFDPADEWLD
mgnify:CR=1 FL=1|jgi:mannose-6-phosphate isomerase-like protein (cupin superfamily)